ncbi:DTW domain containing protein [Perkinsela sp. CCAP 1560/4]|nr:DTW domain containing protein [Perkinsela sp. CCAP 1560/4]|eukprot:KNH04467.1 DTW domain containing protein [Perkinsela sp. CCAP 1560/4]
MNQKHFSFRRSIDKLFEFPPYTESKLFSEATSDVDWLQYIRGTEVQNKNKNVLNTKRRLGMTMQRVQRQNKCKYCWFHRLLCICPNVRPSEPGRFGNIQFHVLMHAREFAKLSNTGRVICGHFDAPLYIGWHPISQQLLDDLCASCNENNLFVLFPETGALSVQNFIDKAQYVSSGMSNAGSDTDIIHVVIIDSSWNESKTLHKLIPERFHRIALDPASVLAYSSLLDPVRCRTRASGVCTTEAVIMFLRSLGSPLSDLSTIIGTLTHVIDLIKLEKHLPGERGDFSPALYEKFVKSLSDRQSQC